MDTSSAFCSWFVRPSQCSEYRPSATTDEKFVRIGRIRWTDFVLSTRRFRVNCARHGWAAAMPTNFSVLCSSRTRVLNRWTLLVGTQSRQTKEQFTSADLSRCKKSMILSVSSGGIRRGVLVAFMKFEGRFVSGDEGFEGNFIRKGGPDARFFRSFIW
jgi:hypothetical protein